MLSPACAYITKPSVEPDNTADFFMQYCHFACQTLSALSFGRSALGLFPQEFSFEILIEVIAIKVADGKVGVFVKDDAALVDLPDFLQVDDKGTVYALEIVGQMVFQLFHAQQYDDGFRLTVEVYLQIFAHALDVLDVADVDAYHFVLGLQKHGIVLVSLRHGDGVLQVELFLHSIGST